MQLVRVDPGRHRRRRRRADRPRCIAHHLLGLLVRGDLRPRLRGRDAGDSSGRLLGDLARTLEARRRNPIARPSLGALLAERTPSLLNSAFGITTIDGVAVAPVPTFNENQPLRDQPPVVNTVPGAIAIQQFLERSAWLGRIADPAAFAPLLQRSPPRGTAARPVLIQLARGDQNTQNPGTSAIIRAGALESSTALYRHDLFYPTVAPTGTQKNPHGFPIVLRASLAPWLPIVAGAQEQIARFLASDGAITITPAPESSGKYRRP